MEEILASIRRIIADDEAKPAGDKAAAAPAKPAMKDIPPSAIPAAAKPAPAAARPAPRPAPPPAPAAAVPNSQDDIDAMLASLDEATPEADIRPPQPDGDVFDLTDEMALPDPPPPPPAPSAASFQKVDPQDDLVQRILAMRARDILQLCLRLALFLRIGKLLISIVHHLPEIGFGLRALRIALGYIRDCGLDLG